MQKTEIKNKELADIEVRYRLAASAHRQVRDELLATYRDMIHNCMMDVNGIDPRILHDVMDSIDRLLYNSKHGPLTD